MNEARIDELHDQNDGGRKGHQQDHGQTSLSSVHPDLAQNLEALADYIRKIVQYLGQVASGFALQHYGGDEELDVDEWDALREIDESVTYGQAEFLFFVELAEFSGDRLGDFVGNHFQGGGEGVSSAHGTGQSVDGLGKFFFKFLKALGAHVRCVTVGSKKAEHGSGPTEDQLAAGHGGDGGQDDRRDKAKDKKVSGANIHAALGEHFLQQRYALGAA